MKTLTPRERMLRDRRSSLLGAIKQHDLMDMRRNVLGLTNWASASDIRLAIFNEWDAYADEIKRWCDFTISGEAVL